MIYLPKIDYPCVAVIDKDTIRAYSIKPYNPNINQGIAINYTDYYVNSHYLTKNGVQQFNYNSSIPSCVLTSDLTTDFYYRNDLDSILIIFLIISIVGFGIPFYLLKRFFRGV